MEAKQVQIRKKKELTVLEDSPDEIWDEESIEEEED